MSSRKPKTSSPVVANSAKSLVAASMLNGDLMVPSFALNMVVASGAKRRAAPRVLSVQPCFALHMVVASLRVLYVAMSEAANV